MKIMKIRLYTILAIVGFCFHFEMMEAQTCEVSGIVTDATSRHIISDANITYTLDGKKQGTRTNGKGQFTFTLPQGRNTTIKITHIGYKPTSKLVVGNKKQVSLKLELTPEASMLDEVVIKRKIPLATMRGDTTVYKTSDFKVNEDASMLDLMQKIPGSGMVDGKQIGRAHV